MKLDCPNCRKEVDFGDVEYAGSTDKQNCEHCGAKFDVIHDCGEYCIEWLEPAP